MNGKLSSEVCEILGCCQGWFNSGDHYKIYTNPALETIDCASLGVTIGPINSGVSCVADDYYLMTDTPSKLQCLLNIAQHLGNMYRIKYGASKTKVTISGPDIDQSYYSDLCPWTMDGERVKVTENNDHIGQLVSGKQQIEKNTDLRLGKARKALFSLFGAGLEFKSGLSPNIKLHIFRTIVSPILRSGLSTFALRKTNIEPLALFQRKTIKSILKLSSTAPTPAIHFLCSELPVEAQIHRDMFMLFHNAWSNPDTKVHQIIKYLLQNSPDNSRTWSINLRHIAKMYSIEDPLKLIMTDPISKSCFRQYILTKITVFHEKELRSLAISNSKMKYFNVSMLGLNNRSHPSLSGVTTQNEVKNMRIWSLKMPKRKETEKSSCKSGV